MALAGSEVIKSELSSYGGKIIGSSSVYVQRNIVNKHFSNPKYYFQVNDDYVINKLKIILLPFMHKGHWMRTVEKIGGELLYKPPIYDINAPDLYIPFMAFGTYLLLAGFFLGTNNKFSPEALGVQLTNGLLCWVFEILLLEATLHALGEGEVPLLDVVAYSGYTFVSVSVALIAKLVCWYLFIIITLWEGYCVGVFLVKVIKRILIAEIRSCDKYSCKRHYLLLLVAFAQLGLLFWLCNVGV